MRPLLGWMQPALRHAGGNGMPGIENRHDEIMARAVARLETASIHTAACLAVTLIQDEIALERNA